MVFANQTTPCIFAPRFGALDLNCNCAGATYTLTNGDNQFVTGGDLPKPLAGLLAGNYILTATFHQHTLRKRIKVETGVTNEVPVAFLFGSATVHSSPAGAIVVDESGALLGTTPLHLSELPQGELRITIQLSDYEPMPVSLDIIGDQNVTFSTNLISAKYATAMNRARAAMRAADYDRAYQAAGDALTAKPGDDDAIALRKEAVAKERSP
jgi:hypothetical protein